MDDASEHPLCYDWPQITTPQLLYCFICRPFSSETTFLWMILSVQRMDYRIFIFVDFLNLDKYCDL